MSCFQQVKITSVTFEIFALFLEGFGSKRYPCAEGRHLGALFQHIFMPSLCFQDWVAQFLPSPLLVFITDQLSVSIYLYIAISIYASQEVILESWRALSIVTNQQSSSVFSVGDLKHTN